MYHDPCIGAQNIETIEPLEIDSNDIGLRFAAQFCQICLRIVSVDIDEFIRGDNLVWSSLFLVETNLDQLDARELRLSRIEKYLQDCAGRTADPGTIGS